MTGGMNRITAETVPRCMKALNRKLPTSCTGNAKFSSLVSSSSRNWASLRRSARRLMIACGCNRSWLIGTHTPLILIVTGDPELRKRSDAFFSDIRLNKRSSAMATPG